MIGCLISRMFMLESVLCRTQKLRHVNYLSHQYVSRSRLTTVNLRSKPTVHGANVEDNDGGNNRKYHKFIASIVSAGIIFLGYSVGKKTKSSCATKAANPDEEAPVDVHLESEDVKGRVSLQEAIHIATDLCQRVKDETGAPGISIAVSVDGKELWNSGFGYADIENRVPCGAHTVMRIASISKPITMTAVAKLWEQDKLDLDKPVNHYVTAWPQKYHNGEKVTITTRQLVSHISGIRHYDKNCGKKKPSDSTDKKSSEKTDKTQKMASGDTNEEEFYLKKSFKSVTEALELFKNDELCSAPGTEYLYTTHGWTLVSAVVEAVSKQKFPVIMRRLFKDLDMENTYLDENDPLIYNRSRHYMKNKQGRIINTPYVDLSYKWAGGGFLSTVTDVNKFGNAMLYCYQHQDNDTSPPGYLKSSTISALWKPEKRAKCDWDTDGFYGLGWGVVTPGGKEYGQCREIREYFSHTGGAIGSTSVLIVLPRRQSFNASQKVTVVPPQGVVVSIIANLTSCKGLTSAARKIAVLFENVE